MLSKSLKILLVILLTLQSVMAVSAVLPMGEPVSDNNEVAAQMTILPMDAMTHDMGVMPPCHTMDDQALTAAEMDCNACGEQEGCTDTCGLSCVSVVSFVSPNTTSLISPVIFHAKKSLTDALKLGAISSIYHPPIFS